MNDKLKIGLIFLAPILVSLLFGALCAFIILTSEMEVYTITPFSGDIFGSFGNALYFVILAGVGASLLYLLLKRKNRRLVALITGFAFTGAVFMLSVVYLFDTFSSFAVSNADVLILTLSTVMTILADFVIFRTRSRVSSLIILCLGGALGTFLGFSVYSTLSVILILSFLAIYDVFAVYRGPVGKIARNGLEQLRGLSFSFKDIQIGLGDLTFYSMLSGHMLIWFGFVSGLAAIAGILFGCFLSFKMLEKKGMFPGLPFPIFLGLAASILASLIRF